jgi:hypothetical protein
MNIEETKKAIEVMQAFVDGKTVQVETHAGWEDVDDPLWEWFGGPYRVKPQEPKEIWVNEYEGGWGALVYNSKEEAVAGSAPYVTRTAVRYREVIEE